MTSYDRKMEARRAAEEKAKKNKLVTTVVAIVAVVLIIVAVVWAKVAAPIKDKADAKKIYCKIGSHEVNRAEYDYFYYTSVNEYINIYGTFLQYMGLDTSKDFDSQMYDEDKTWKDAFDDMTTGRIQAVYAYYDDSIKNNYEFDVEAAYADYLKSIDSAMQSANVTEEKYYEGMFGKYASKDALENIVKITLTADAYMDKLTEDNAPTDAEIENYYNEHKDDYDKVSYYAVTVDDGEAEEPSFEKAKEQAESIRAQVADGVDFDKAASEYVPFEEGVSSYISTDLSKSSINSEYSDWLFDESRKSGDVTVIEDEDGESCYVVSFVERTAATDYADSIKNTLSSEAVNEYMKPIFDQYPVTDVAGELKYLLIDYGDEDAEDAEAEEE